MKPLDPAADRIIRTQVEADLAGLQKRNESTLLDETHTAVLRGRIMALRGVIAWLDGDHARIAA